MESVEKAFERLLKRQPSEAEKVRLFELKDALGLAPDDALWLMFLGLQYHQSIYEEIPARISSEASAATRAMIEEFENRFDTKLRKADRHLQKVGDDVLQQIAADSKTVMKKAINQANNKTSPWAYLFILLTALALTAGGFGGCILLLVAKGILTI